MFLLAMSVVCAAGCTVRNAYRSPWDAETEIFLREPNFETAKVHAVGSASCDYILWMIPLCANQNIATRAWEEMARQAGVEGRAAQFVDVTVDDIVRWNVLGLWFRQIYAVSADVIVYRDLPDESATRHPDGRYVPASTAARQPRAAR
jgi:hypothetical protein